MDETNPYDAIANSEDTQVLQEQTPVLDNSIYDNLAAQDETTTLKGQVSQFDLARNITMGMGPIYQGSEGMRLVFDNDYDAESARSMVESQSYLEAVKGQKEYEKENGDWHWGVMLGKSAEQLPFMGLGAVGGLSGAAVGTGVAMAAANNARIGASIGTAAALALNFVPGAALTPEEAVTIPALSSIGAGIGAFTVIAPMMAGQAMYEYHVNKGLDRQWSKAAAGGVGVVQGMLEIAGFDIGIKGMKNAADLAFRSNRFKNTLAKSPEFMQLMAKQTLNFFRTMGEEISVEVAQDVTSKAVELALEAMKRSKEGKPIHNLGDILGEFAKTTAETIKSTAQATPGLLLTGHVTSATVGTTAARVSRLLDIQNKKMQKKAAEVAKKEAEAAAAEQEAKAAEVAQAKEEKKTAYAEEAKLKAKAISAERKKRASEGKGYNPNDELEAVQVKIEEVKNEIQNTPYEAQIDELEKELKDLRAKQAIIKGAIRLDRKKHNEEVLQELIAKEAEALKEATDKQQELQQAEKEENIDARLEKIKDFDAAIALKQDEESALMLQGEAHATVTEEIAALKKERAKAGKGILNSKRRITKLKVQMLRKTRDFKYIHKDRVDLAAKVEAQESRDKAEITKEIESKLKRIRKKDEVRGMQASRYPGKQDVLDTIDDLWKSEEAAKEAMEKHQSNLEEGKSDPAQEARGIIAGKLFWKARKDMTSDDLQNINNELDFHMGEGKKTLIGKITEIGKRRKALKETLAARIGTSETSTKQDRGWKDKFLELADRYWGHHFSWEGNQVLITKNTGGHDNLDLFNPLSLLSEALKGTQEWQEKINAAFVESTNRSAEEVRKYISEGDKETLIGVVTIKDENENLSQHELHLTRNQAIQLLAFTKDEELKDRLKAGGFVIRGSKARLKSISFKEDISIGTSVEEALENYLNDGMGAGIIKGLNRIYNEYFSRVNKYTEEKTGQSLEKNKGYHGSASAEGGLKESTNSMFRRATARPGHMLARTENSQPVALDSFADKLKEHIQSTEYAIAFKDFEGDVPAVFGDKEIRDAIRDNIGPWMNDLLNQHINDLIRGYYQVYSAQSNIIGHVRSNFYGSVLLGRLDQYFKNVTGILNARLFVSQEEFNEGLADYIRDPESAIKTMNESALLKARSSLIDESWRPSALTSKQANVLAADPSWKSRATWDEILSLTISMGDLHSVYAGFWSVYRAELKKTGSKAKAMAAFERAFNSVQGSGSVDQNAAIFRGSNIERSLAQFAQQPTRFVEHLATAYIKAQHAKDPQAKKDALKKAATIYATMVASEAAFNAAGLAFKLPFAKDDDDRAKMVNEYAIKLPMASLTGLPLIGPMLYVMGGTVLGTFAPDKLQFRNGGNLYYEIGKQVVDAGNRIQKVKSGDFKASDMTGLILNATKGYEIGAPKKMGGGIPWHIPVQWLHESVKRGED